jgi:hypothetical protein
MSEKDQEKAIEALLKSLVGKDPLEEVKKNPLHVNTVASTLEQYLTPFICFGYDINGDAVVLSNAQSQRDIDGIMLSIGRYMAQQRMGQMNDDIGDMLDDE